MINTLFSSGKLDSPTGFVEALLIGMAFGFILQRAGFGSSRRLTGVFYFKDMTVIKVMFTAVITAMIGLAFCRLFGWITPDNIYLLPTVYGAQIVGGLIFGVGFAMGGWCPGTAAAGLAQGKLDALLFLIGGALGSILFNELYFLVKPLYMAGSAGVLFIFNSLYMSQETFILCFTTMGILCFVLCEYLESGQAGIAMPVLNPMLKAVSLCFVVLAVTLSLTALPGTLISQPLATGDNTPHSITMAVAESQLLGTVDQARDHMEPESLANRLMVRDPTLLLVDVRPAVEYTEYHIPGAVNIAMTDLHTALAPYKNMGTIVLYSNGMTHPAQARDSMARTGFDNVFILTDGLTGFQQRCLKPVSLRSVPLTPEQIATVNQWRTFFNAKHQSLKPLLHTETLPLPPKHSPTHPVALPGALVETSWLTDHLTDSTVVIIDLRAQPQYNTSHIPGSLSLGVENIRTHVLGLGSMLSPVELLARQVSLMGILPENLIVLVPSDGIRDATLVSLALERLGHTAYAVLNGGYDQWITDKYPINTALPNVTQSRYPTRWNADQFTVTASTVLEAVQQKKAVILDVRPREYFLGIKSDEARAGHIPGALNRSFTEDTQKGETITVFKPMDELAKAYADLIPSTDTRVIVYCRTGHQASQTVFVLKRLLGYKHIFWYDGGWSEWAALPTLPIEQKAL